ncbi:hypothetical protein BC629DRAFT_1435094 [Irpex lacteus]|nr:hypothetical protein BC629DRAFT_1435094 [Irpex lacteus]
MPTNSRRTGPNTDQAARAQVNDPDRDSLNDYHWKPIDDPLFMWRYTDNWHTAVEKRLEGWWYGLYDFIIHNAIRRTLKSGIPEEVSVNVIPQAPLTQLSWSEAPAESRDEGDFGYNQDTRKWFLTPAARFSPTDPPRPRVTRSNVPPTYVFESLSTAGQRIQGDIDSASARLSSLSISTGGNALDAVEADSHDGLSRIPDYVVETNKVLRLPSSPQPFDGEEFNTDYVPDKRILIIWEIKRLPDLWYQLSTQKPEERKDVMVEIEKVLNQGMRQQVYQQIVCAFEEYKDQVEILHGSGVGDFCRLRMFDKGLLEENGLLGRKLDKRRVPRWHEMVNYETPIFRMIERGESDFHPAFKEIYWMARQKTMQT